jgi:hypothetical protein
MLIILDTTKYWTFHRSEHQGMAKKKHLNLLLLHRGTASQTISGLKTVFSQFKSLMQSWNGTKCCCSACR